MTAQPGGTITATGEMNSRRVFHTATLMTDGRILIAGGFSSNGAPSARVGPGVFSPIHSMTIPRV
jgi:hypothetical protein